MPAAAATTTRPRPANVLLASLPLWQRHCIALDYAIRKGSAPGGGTKVYPPDSSYARSNARSSAILYPQSIWRDQYRRMVTEVAAAEGTAGANTLQQCIYTKLGEMGVPVTESKAALDADFAAAVAAGAAARTPGPAPSVYAPAHPGPGAPGTQPSTVLPGAAIAEAGTAVVRTAGAVLAVAAGAALLGGLVGYYIGRQG